MRICERGQGAQRPILLPDQPQEEIPSCGLAPTLATAMLPDCVGESRRSLSGQSDGMSDGKLVYAVYASTETKQAYLSGRASRNPTTDCRFVEEDVSDEMLLGNVAEGDKAAMHILFARHRTGVFRFIQRMVRDPATADDLVSQVFLDVWRSANRFENRARVSTWLFQIARFKAMGSLRQRTFENIDQDDMLGTADAGDTPEAALDRKETNGILRACIEKLSPAHREIIDLVYYRENSVAEASEILGIPQATVKSRMFYARKQLARILVGTGLEAAAVRENTVRSRAAKPSRGLHLDMRVGLPV